MYKSKGYYGGLQMVQYYYYRRVCNVHDDMKRAWGANTSREPWISGVDRAR
jgi:hypothetical protein